MPDLTINTRPTYEVWAEVEYKPFLGNQSRHKSFLKRQSWPWVLVLPKVTKPKSSTSLTRQSRKWVPVLPRQIRNRLLDNHCRNWISVSPRKPQLDRTETEDYSYSKCQLQRCILVLPRQSEQKLNTSLTKNVRAEAEDYSTIQTVRADAEFYSLTQIVRAEEPTLSSIVLLKVLEPKSRHWVLVLPKLLEPKSRHWVL